MQSKSLLLNIGCGAITNPYYENIDIIPQDALAKKVNILERLPYNDNIYEFCYSSHLLEHLNKAESLNFLSEVIRVLQVDGVCRIVVPDLERTVSAYLEVLHQLKNGNLNVEYKYDWLLVELFDQLIRNKSGGEMYKFIQESDNQLAKYISERLGPDILELKNPRIKKESLFIKTLKSLKFLPKKSSTFFLYVLIYSIKGKVSADNFRISEFRSQGEIHKWMYDSFSLARLMRSAGFRDVKLCTAKESYSSKFLSMNLDLINGKQRKLDSIYIEGIK